MGTTGGQAGMNWIKKLFCKHEKNNGLVPLYYSKQAIKNHQYALKRLISYIQESGNIAIKEISLPTLIELENDFWHNSHWKQRGE
jgi:hypothetical protein